ncbi:conserved hypothetical protein [Sporisorium reilianum SRZ2]|uniref:Uncharacterized protein n=1 Tax=Sporisorium reilianum (strain SRZ2) TaxID=999809 RepID=E6ZKU8_SPORE|nr:conserved hypothetical protein [Sporisorium reilianum SRZ2]
MGERSGRLLLYITVLVMLVSPRVLGYKLSPVDGQADIGAYHVQPGRCAGVESRLRTKYRYFFGASPFHTTFDQIVHPDPTVSSSAGSGTNVEQMDATALCAFNPLLTEGYGGGFDSLNFYLVYSRCIYGTDEMRVLCGTTDGKGVPIDSYFNLIQAKCPQGTRCKNLCASMTDPKLTSPYAAKQVQLAQCMPDAQWQHLTDMYRPKTDSGPAGGKQPEKPEATNVPKVDPTVVDKPPANPTKDETKPAKDGTIAGKVLPAPADAKKDDAAKPAEPPKQPAPAPAPATGKDDAAHTTGHFQISPIVILMPQPQLNPPKEGDKPPAQPAKAEPPKAADPKAADPKPADPKAAGPDAGKDDGKLPPQKAPTAMGFRKRSLSSGFRHHRRSAAAV